MYENFTRIPLEEQQRILAACTTEFAQHGFSQASTNAIIQKAGIPKGTLFFFFGSKKDLYLYVIDRAVTAFTQAFEELAGQPPADLFERMVYFGQVRMTFALREPMLYRLFFNAFANTPEEIRVEIQQRYAGYARQSMHMLLDGLDLTPFRPDVSVEQVIQMANLLLEGLFSRFQQQAVGLDGSLDWVEGITGEVRGYFELIKQGAYRRV